MFAFRRHWLKGVLLALLIAESSFSLALVVERYVQAYEFGGFQYGCSSLQAATVSNDSFIRWVRLTCPNAPAVRMTPNGYCGVHENPCTLVIPTYTSPRGLLGLYAVDHANPACPDNSHPYAGYLLISGLGQVYGSWGFGATDIDYCAVTKASAGTMEGFSLQWSLGETTTLPPSFRSSVSASNVTVAHGGTAVFTMTVTSKDQFFGNLSFIEDRVIQVNGAFPPTLTFNSGSVILKADGTNSTMVTIQASPYTSLGPWYAYVDITPVYGLNYYGGYGYSYSSYQTTVEVYVI
jgi:hypothetical protein